MPSIVPWYNSITEKTAAADAERAPRHTRHSLASSPGLFEREHAIHMRDYSAYRSLVQVTNKARNPIMVILWSEQAGGDNSKMDTLWSELQTKGIEVEETDISQEEFERLFRGEKEAAPGND